jgi:hypothetical protein
MKAYELADITKRAIEKRKKERPLQLFNDLIVKMKSEAELGYDHIDLAFSDTKDIVDEVLVMLKERGYDVTLIYAVTVYRIGWDKL